MRAPGRKALAKYLASLFGEEVVIRAVKGLPHGERFVVEYDTHGEPQRAVFEAIRPGPYGHEDMAVGAHKRLPRHARSLDVGAVSRGGRLESIGEIEEVFLVREFAAGVPYREDLERLASGAELTPQDASRADALCDYLVDVHGVRGGEPSLYARRIRELVGHGEGIMGVVDRYPAGASFLVSGILEEIERHAVSWRWRLRDRAHRLRQVHGGFHPGNILFRDATRFTVLGRSRGQWGEPADDVVFLTMHYVAFALAGEGRFEGAFRTLFLRFWSRYLETGNDPEILEVCPPFVAFRSLVLASPEWFPALGDDARRKMLTFALRVLERDAFEPDQIGPELV